MGGQAIQGVAGFLVFAALVAFFAGTRAGRTAFHSFSGCFTWLVILAVLAICPGFIIWIPFGSMYSSGKAGAIQAAKSEKLAEVLEAGGQIRYWGDESRFTFYLDENGQKRHAPVPKGTVLELLSTRNDELARAADAADWDELLRNMTYLPVVYPGGHPGVVLLADLKREIYDFSTMEAGKTEMVWLCPSGLDYNYCLADDGTKVPIFSKETCDGAHYMAAELREIDHEKQLARIRIVEGGTGEGLVPFGLIKGMNPLSGYRPNPGFFAMVRVVGWSSLAVVYALAAVMFLLLVGRGISRRMRGGGYSPRLLQNLLHRLGMSDHE